MVCVLLFFLFLVERLDSFKASSLFLFFFLLVFDKAALLDGIATELTSEEAISDVDWEKELNVPCTKFKIFC